MHTILGEDGNQVAFCYPGISISMMLLVMLQLCSILATSVKTTCLWKYVHTKSRRASHRKLCCLKIELSLIYEVVPQNVHEYEHRDKDKLNTGH